MKHLLFILLSLIPLVTQAEPAIVPHFLPDGVQWVQGKEERKCYSLDEYKLVLQLDYDQFVAKKELILMRDRLQLSDQLAALHREQIQSLLVDVSIWKDEYQRSNALWKRTDKKLQESKGDSSILWMVLGGEVAVAIVSVTILVLAVQ